MTPGSLRAPGNAPAPCLPSVHSLSPQGGLDIMRTKAITASLLSVSVLRNIRDHHSLSRLYPCIALQVSSLYYLPFPNTQPFHDTLSTYTFSKTLYVLNLFSEYLLYHPALGCLDSPENTASLSPLDWEQFLS